MKCHVETSAAKSIKMWTFLRMCESGWGGGNTGNSRTLANMLSYRFKKKKCIFFGEYVYFW